MRKILLSSLILFSITYLISNYFIINRNNLDPGIRAVFSLEPSFFFIGMFYAILEELLFRKYLLEYLKKPSDHNLGLIILIGSTIFALYHVHYGLSLEYNLHKVIISFIYGVMASYFYLETNSVFITTIHHIIWNTFLSAYVNLYEISKDDMIFMTFIIATASVLIHVISKIKFCRILNNHQN